MGHLVKDAARKAAGETLVNGKGKLVGGFFRMRWAVEDDGEFLEVAIRVALNLDRVGLHREGVIHFAGDGAAVNFGNRR